MPIEQRKTQKEGSRLQKGLGDWTFHARRVAPSSGSPRARQKKTRRPFRQERRDEKKSLNEVEKKKKAQRKTGASRFRMGGGGGGLGGGGCGVGGGWGCLWGGEGCRIQKKDGKRERTCLSNLPALSENVEGLDLGTLENDS